MKCIDSRNFKIYNNTEDTMKDSQIFPILGFHEIEETPLTIQSTKKIK